MRFLLPLCLAAVLGSAGCASSQAKLERATATANTREIERRRMQEVERGSVASRRGAEILVPDEHRTFDPSGSAAGSTRKFGTGGARTKEFYYEQKARAGTYRTRDFYGSKAASVAERKFATDEAYTPGKYAIPNADTAATTKTAATKEARDAGKVAATRELRDANRPYLGPESKKFNTAIDQTKNVGWRGTFTPLSIEDVRDLLNKN